MAIFKVTKPYKNTLLLCINLEKMCKAKLRKY